MAIAEKAKERAQKKKANAAWSGKMEKAEQRVKRKEKRVAKAKWARANAAMDVDEQAAPADGGPSKRARDADGALDDDDDDDWDELAREERMAKKVKKGEVSQKQFDAEFGDL